VERQQWDPDWRFASELHAVRAIDSSSSLGTQPPSNLAQSFSFADHRATKLTATFTPGSVIAKTEVWLRHASFASTLVATLDEGLARFTLDADALGIDLKHEVCFVKLRHTRGGVQSEFTGEVEFYPQLRPPVITVKRVIAVGSDSYRQISVTNYGNNSLVQNVYGDETGGSWSKDWLDAAPGVLTDNTATITAAAEAGQSPDLYSATLEQTAFIGHDESEANTVPVMSAGAGTSTPSLPAQDMSQDLAAASIAVNAMPRNWSATYTIEYRVFGSGSGWTVGPTYATAASPADLQSQRLTITGLAASTKYEVRHTNTASGGVSSAGVAMYTKLSAPTIAVVQGGLGTPDVDITITVAAVNNGRDVRVYSASNTAGTPGYSVLHAALPTGATVVNSTAGTCGVLDHYFGCTVDATWPTGWTHSDPASDDILDPCA
jgi:hypothetical protein